MAELILDAAGSNMGSASFDVQEGRLVGVHASSPFDDADIELSGGELVLSSSGANPAVYDNAVTVSEDSLLTAGAAGGGVAGAINVQLGSGANGLGIDAGKTPTVRSTNGYSLEVLGSVTGNGGIDVTEGSLTLAGAGNDFGSAKLSGGNVSLNDALTVGNLDMAGGTLAPGGNTVTVNNTLSLNASDLDMTGAVLGTAAATVDIGGGRTLTYDKALTANTLDISGTLARTGAGAADRNINAGTLNFRNGTLTMAGGQTLNVTSSALVESGAILAVEGTMTRGGVARHARQTAGK